jgi:hypothetical protein
MANMIRVISHLEQLPQREIETAHPPAGQIRSERRGTLLAIGKSVPLAAANASPLAADEWRRLRRDQMPRASQFQVGVANSRAANVLGGLKSSVGGIQYQYHGGIHSDLGEFTIPATGPEQSLAPTLLVDN